MKVTILPTSPSDAPSLAEILGLAYRNDARNQSILPSDITDEQREEFDAFRANMIRDRSSQPNRYFFKAVDAVTGRIVGYSGWFGPEERDEAAPAGKSAAVPGNRFASLPQFVKKGALEETEKKVKAMRSQILGTRKDVWFLQAMVVHPNFQRQGIASQLVRHGLDTLIDVEGGGACYLESTPTAKGVYRKHGFAEKAVIPFLSGSYEITIMMRDVINELA